ncbi:probable disease resistance protein At4g27220 [Actinidia eriantha]|uniref:probable disease resistance protein At4g27220 n=1 Tax=Actinidia eriantha TaxID=165200 RepID=UPI002590C952|nr:probable disease resistance protein At4g27220 [Actinidia eriantha]
MAEKKLGNIAQQIKYFIGQDEKMQTLRKNFKRLSCQAADVKEKVEAEEFRSGKKRKRVVENWLEEVEMMKNKVQKLEEIQESQISSLLSGNRIDKLIKEIEELHEEGEFPGGLLLDTCETSVIPLLARELTIQTSKRNLEELFKYLMDDEIWCIGIHGIGGVGKTTLALHIYNRLRQDVEMFGYRPYWVTVSQENSTDKLQNDIAKNLGLDFSNELDKRRRISILSRALTRENCVLILDDVWEKIDLDKVGLPDKVNGHKTCKLILTTRSLDVCRRIGCQAKFKVQPLNEEEAWKLFEENLGQQTELSPGVRDIAMSVAAKCAGLPLAIITMSGSMREVSDIQEWRNVLTKLKELTMGQEDMENEVYPILELSYSRLKDMKLKLCFLYCALYPEDRNIKRDELIGYFISEGLIDEGKPWQAKFDEGHSMLNTLERSCLLENCNSDDGHRCVKMHDLMRDMALKITKVGHPRFMVKAGVGLWDIPAEREWTEDLDMVSLMDNCIEEIPHGRSPRCPRLSTLLLNENCLRKIAASFFEHMHELHVLDLSMNEDLEKLPNSISDLVNLTALKLQGCSSLTYVPPLGKLRALQELDLNCTSIKELPEGVDRLVNLKNLNMEQTLELETLPSGILGKLSHLQCLRLSTYGLVEVQAKELEGLRELTEITVRHCDIDVFKQFVKYLQQAQFGRQLDKYFLAVCDGEYNYMTYNDDFHFNKVLILSGRYNVNGGEGEDGILLPSDLQCLKIKESSFSHGSACLYDYFSPFTCGNATLLKECKLSYCDGIESITSSSTSSYSSTSFQSLEKLYIDGLPDFVSLFGSKFLGFAVIAPSCGTFSNLKYLIVGKCPKIKSLFTSVSLLFFPNLEKIDVRHCAQIKEIIETIHDDNDHDVPLITLPKLRKIKLVDLPELNSIFDGRMVCGSIKEITVHICPKLKEFDVVDCDGIESIILSGSSSYSSTSTQSLEKLYIDGLPDFVSPFGSKFLGFAVIAPSCGPFSNLKYLRVDNCPKIKSLFTSISLLLFPNLEEIDVRHCAQIKEIIETIHDDNNRDVPLITLPKLRKIKLVDLPELKSIFDPKIFPNLEEIDVRHCTQIKEIIKTVHDVPLITLQKLRKIELLDLPKLNSIFEGRMVCESIKEITVHICPKLKEFAVVDCNEIESIILSGTSLNSLTSFKRFKGLCLDRLPDFLSLFRLKSSGTFSNLKYLRVGKCPKIKSLFTSVSLLFFPNLEKIDVRHCAQIKEIIETVHDDNDHDVPLITLPKLRKIELVDLPELNSIFDGRMVCGSIKEITVRICPKLKEFDVVDCDGIESIILSGSSSYSSTSTQSLEKLYIDGLPDFVFPFGSKFLGFAVIAPSCGPFSNLKYLRVDNCPKIKSLFTSISLLLFPNLEEIDVRHCAQIKEIIETIHDDNNRDVPLITLPKLRKIELVDIPKLKSIFERRMVCESIEIIRVYGCPKLRRLPFSLTNVNANGQLSVPTTLETISIGTYLYSRKGMDIEWWESLEWDHPNAKDALLPYLG